MTVAVRIIIDEAGVVREVLESPLDDCPTSDRCVVCRAVGEEAVRRWKFHPATIRTLKLVRSYLDLRFTFEVVSAAGRRRAELVAERRLL